MNTRKLKELYTFARINKLMREDAAEMARTIRQSIDELEEEIALGMPGDWRKDMIKRNEEHYAFYIERAAPRPETELIEAVKRLQEIPDATLQKAIIMHCLDGIKWHEVEATLGETGLQKRCDQAMKAIF